MGIEPASLALEGGFLTTWTTRKERKCSHSVMSDSLRLPWIVAGQAPLSMGVSRQEYWSGLLFPPPGDLPDPGIETGSPALQVDSLPSESLISKTSLSSVLRLYIYISSSVSPSTKLYSRFLVRNL